MRFHVLQIMELGSPIGSSERPKFGSHPKVDMPAGSPPSPAWKIPKKAPRNAVQIRLLTTDLYWAGRMFSRQTTGGFGIQRGDKRESASPWHF